MAVALSAGCGEPTDSVSHTVQLDPYASVIAPPSMIDEIVLLEGDLACVIDTYWYRVACTDPGGESFRFGKEGEGPGELTDPFAILRGPGATIGVVDMGLGRLSVFSKAGEFLTSTPGLPRGFLGGGSQEMAGTLVGTHLKRDPDGGFFWVNVEIDPGTGRVVWERAFPDEAAVVDCSTPTPGSRRRQLSLGYDDRGGGRLFVTCYGEFLVWYGDREADEPDAIVRSTYVERYPTDEDVEAALERLNSIPAGGWRPDTSEEGIRERPRVWYGSRVVDDRRRFWAVSQWNSEPAVIPAFSHIDVFRLADTGPEYALTLQVADKVVGMDVLGNTLAVLVERDTGGVVRERRVDWYDVTHLASQR